MHLTDALVRNAAERADAPAIRDAQDESWADFTDSVARLATRLADRGIAPGDRVAILAANTPDNLRLLSALHWAAAVPVPLNTRYAPPEMADVLARADVALLVHDTSHAAQVSALPPGAGPALAALEDLTDDLTAVAASPRAPGQPGDLAGIYFTGGTTGAPKGVLLTQAAVMHQNAVLKQACGFDAEATYLHAAPLFHLADCGLSHATSAGGGAHAFLPAFTPEAVPGLIAARGVTHLNMVPTMLARLLDAAGGAHPAFGRVRSITYGGAPIGQDLLIRVRAAFPGARMQQIYGQTELCGPCLILPPERHVTAGPLAGKLSSAGLPVATCEVMLSDAAGQPVPQGQPGEIRVRSIAAMAGYWGAPKAGAAALSGGWLRTGDVGVADADGFITIVDRIKDMIVTGGENVFSGEVEAAILTHPGVAECAVIGLPDRDYGERVHAVVVSHPGSDPLSLETLRAYLRARIAGYKAPRSLSLRRTPLPLSALGKVQKNVLRAQALAAIAQPETAS
ncbi:MAG: AMP-binding protein [Rhodobacteraceae bacterium]|nr:AMP-binding protein [Paracoccaceae bacterium]